MQPPMGNERPTTNTQGQPLSPFSSVPQPPAPFASPGPASQMPTPMMPTSIGRGTPPPYFQNSAPITAPLARFNGPSSSPTPAFPASDANLYPRSAPPSVAPLRGPVGVMGGPPPIAQPGSLSQRQLPSVPMAPPTQNANPYLSQVSPPSLSSFPAPPRSTLQPPSGSYASIPLRGTVPGQAWISPSGLISQTPLQAPAAANAPRQNVPFQAQQGGLMPPAPPPPPVGPTFGFNSREQMQYPGMAPPTGGPVQGLVEEFQSLSIGSTPGSLDAGLDRKLLPRPSDSDLQSASAQESYPLNCHPRYFRLTTHAIPSSQSLLARWHLPLGAVVHPLAESPDGDEVPVVNFGSAGIVRCRRCRTYINPYVTFTDAGRKWRCNLCSLLNDVSGEYYCALDANGRRCDFEQRPELSRGSVEFVAPTEYMIRPPMPPVYFFVIDVSVSAVRSGVLEVIARTIKSCLDELPGSPRTQIGFLTFDSAMHFYCLKSSFTQPQMMIVTDLDDLFLPVPDDLLVNLSDSRHVVDSLLDTLPTMFQDNLNVESAFGPAMKAAFMIMSQLGGKVLVFQSTLPSIGVGRLRLRGEDPRVYGTDKEYLLRVPEEPFYKQTAAEFTKHQIAVDIYAFSDKFSDIASLGTLAKYTGGQVYHYPSFRAAVHHEKFSHELRRDLTRETAWEAVMRIRCGKGIRFTTYHGHFMLRSTDLLALPAVDCDKAFAMQLSLEETLMTTQTVYFQVALLYTSSSGERRIRVLTAAAPVVSDLGEMYRQADTGAIVSLLGRLAIEKSLSSKLEDTRQFVQFKLIKSLKEYRNLYVLQHRLVGRLIYPESLRLLPLYILVLCKSLALRGGYAETSLDERCAAGYRMMILPIRRMLKLLYPSMMRIDDNLTRVATSPEEHLKDLPLTGESLDPRGLYLVDDGFEFIIWFGRVLPSDLVMNILGADLNTYPDLSVVSLSEIENEFSRKLMSLLRRLRNKDASYYQLPHLVSQGEQPREGSLFLSRLVEDQIAGSVSYIDWILQTYRQLQGS